MFDIPNAKSSEDFEEVGKRIFEEFLKSFIAEYSGNVEEKWSSLQNKTMEE